MMTWSKVTSAGKATESQLQLFAYMVDIATQLPLSAAAGNTAGPQCATANAKCVRSPTQLATLRRWGSHTATSSNATQKHLPALQRSSILGHSGTSIYKLTAITN
jgi:hypothetical protein